MKLWIEESQEWKIRFKSLGILINKKVTFYLNSDIPVKFADISRTIVENPIFLWSFWSTMFDDCRHWKESLIGHRFSNLKNKTVISDRNLIVRASDSLWSTNAKYGRRFPDSQHKRSLQWQTQWLSLRPPRSFIKSEMCFVPDDL
jgi:hypothetical protein